MRFPPTGAICIVDEAILKENEEHRLKPEVPKFLDSEEFIIYV